jgi:hypothetical protein
MASKMRLSEHPDFGQAIIATRAHLGEFGLTEQLIEKDYYVTEALRAAVALLGDRVIFKGGTSLSKGWGLIQRFSEDVDLFVNPTTELGLLSKRGIDRELKWLRDAVGSHPGLVFDSAHSRTTGGFGRSDYFRYAQRFAGLSSVAAAILIEAGTSSGLYPTETRTISSDVAIFLRQSGQTLGTEDETTFEVPLLHFRRTFVEKLFAIHAKVEIVKRDGSRLGGYARRYYDMSCLLKQVEVLSMLASPEYEDIRSDYERISLESFPRDYSRPPDLRFAQSDAIFPSGKLRTDIAADYEAQCRALCYGPYPSWAEVEAGFMAIRSLL